MSRTRTGSNSRVGSTATDEEILAHARVHARSVADEIGVDLDGLEWDVSPRAKRRAGACRWNATDETATIVLSRRAYERYDRADFEAIVRHELIHAWEYQTFGESDHGSRFRERAEAFDVPIRCESFTEPRYRLRCRREACDWSLARHRASKPVKTPERYRCGECGADLTVEHADSGRTWTTSAGYGGARSALGDDW
ncbi:SprT-like domain-containing protein [Halovivax gelatinilyticus]|uniref:SprT-like domain-containing protein n=1 Tax=Halovivax gelatinilyticus TaxID=2961597 RepID=UPI0020CA3635|nr:SprT-like domain-containing protein [Halovivax gelatinilyticus]